jgi:hypothetical protein
MSIGCRIVDELNATVTQRLVQVLIGRWLEHPPSHYAKLRARLHWHSPYCSRGIIVVHQCLIVDDVVRQADGFSGRNFCIKRLIWMSIL